METCKCGSNQFVYQLKIIATNRPNPKPWDAKFIPQIQIRCLSCDAFIRQERQTQEVVDQLTLHLEDQRFTKSGSVNNTVILVKKRIKRSLFD